MHSSVIRPAAVDDVEDVLALWRAADAHPTVTDTPSAVRRLITEHPESLLVAELDGRLIGTIIAGWDGWRGTLYRLAVIPEMRRRGVARVLVDAAMRRFSDRGVERISAFVVESDGPAVGFWNSLPDLGIVLDPNPKRRYVANLAGRGQSKEEEQHVGA